MGKGIDVVILGDFFKAEDLKKDGKWEQAINIFMEYMFAMEPYKSYRDYFNIYAVPHLCEYELPEIDSGDEVETPFATYRGTGLNETNGVSSNRQQMAAAYKYAYEHTPVAADKGTWRDLTVGLVLNTEFRKYGIVAWSNNVNRYEDCGMSLTPIPIFGEGWRLRCSGMRCWDTDSAVSVKIISVELEHFPRTGLSGHTRKCIRHVWM